MRRSRFGLGLLMAFTIACFGEPEDDLENRIRQANEEILNQGNVAAVGDFFGSAYTLHVTGQDTRGGPELIEAFVQNLRATFPDLHVEVEILVSDDDRVAWVRRHRGTHQAEFMGVPASGRAINWTDMVVTRFDDGKIVEEWGVSDLAEKLLAQR